MAIVERLRAALSLSPDHATQVFDGPGTRSDFDLNPQWRTVRDEKPLRPSARPAAQNPFPW